MRNCDNILLLPVGEKRKGRASLTLDGPHHGANEVVNPLCPSPGSKEMGRGYWFLFDIGSICSICSIPPYLFIGFSPASARASLICMRTAFSIGIQEKPRSFFARASLTSQGNPDLPFGSHILFFPKVIFASGI